MTKLLNIKDTLLLIREYDPEGSSGTIDSTILTRLNLLAKKGAIKTMKCGRSHMFDSDDIIALINSDRVILTRWGKADLYAKSREQGEEETSSIETKIDVVLANTEEIKQQVSDTQRSVEKQADKILARIVEWETYRDDSFLLPLEGTRRAELDSDSYSILAVKSTSSGKRRTFSNSDIKSLYKNPLYHKEIVVNGKRYIQVKLKD